MPCPLPPDPTLPVVPTAQPSVLSPQPTQSPCVPLPACPTPVSGAGSVQLPSAGSSQPVSGQSCVARPTPTPTPSATPTRLASPVPTSTPAVVPSPRPIAPGT